MEKGIKLSSMKDYLIRLGNKVKNRNTLFVGMIVLMILPIFGALGKMPIRLWDESRLATNAIEMARNNKWLVPTFGGAPDMWNTKPPLLIWMQASLIKITGINPLAIRLPVAIAVAFTCIYLFFILGKLLKDYKFGFIVVLVLLTTGAYITQHVARTGDYDGLLILFTTLFSFSYFQYLTTFRVKHLYLFFLFLSLAVLTKSVAGLIFLPGLFAFTLLQKKLKQVLSNKHLYFGLILFVLLTASYYLLREIYNPGYLKAVYENELGGRFLETLEEHNHSFYYYFEFRNFYYWLPLFIAGLVLGLRMKKSPLKEVVLFSIISGFGFLFIISLSQTKLGWYDAPAYPFIAIVTAVPICIGYEYLKNRFQNRDNWKRIIPVTAIILLFAFPYGHTLKRVISPTEASWETPLYRMPWYLKGMISGTNNLPITNVIIDDYQPQISFYIAMANEKGFSIRQEGSADVTVGESVLVDNKASIEKIKSRFNTETKYDWNDMKVLDILSKKNDTTFINK